MNDGDQPANDGFSRLLREVDDLDPIDPDPIDTDPIDPDLIDTAPTDTDLDTEFDDGQTGETDLANEADEIDEAIEVEAADETGQPDTVVGAGAPKDSNASGARPDGDVIAILLFGLAVIVALALLA